MTKRSADGGGTQRGFGSERIKAGGRECAGARLLLTTNMMEKVKYASSTCRHHYVWTFLSLNQRERRKRKEEIGGSPSLPRLD